jgi:hypothetical protein
VSSTLVPGFVHQDSACGYLAIHASRTDRGELGSEDILHESLTLCWYGDQIADRLKEGRGFISELGASRQVARWAYSRTEAAKGLTWPRADVMEPLGPGWREFFQV